MKVGDRNIVLIGFMGTGKSSVGRRLAANLKRRFHDSDSEIELKMGMNVAKIFERYGEKRFREEEAQTLKELGVKRGLVISTGGGAVLNPLNVEALRKYGIFVLLTASPEVIYRRVKNNEDRPLLKTAPEKAVERISDLLSERERAYQIADIIIDTSNLTVNEVVEQIIRVLSD